MKSLLSQIQSLISTAETFKDMGDRAWEKVKDGFESYADKASRCYDKVQLCLDHANELISKLKD